MRPQLLLPTFPDHAKTRDVALTVAADVEEDYDEEEDEEDFDPNAPEGDDVRV